jgi:hypothetical protein
MAGKVKPLPCPSGCLHYCTKKCKPGDQHRCGVEKACCSNVDCFDTRRCSRVIPYPPRS